jgi:hypothetical protein
MNKYIVSYTITDKNKFTTFHAVNYIQAKTPIRAIKFLSTPDLNYDDILTITCTPDRTGKPTD